MPKGEHRTEPGPLSDAASPKEVLAFAADMAVELSVLCAARGFDGLGARFLDAAAEARRLRALNDLSRFDAKDADHPNDDDASAT
jgi:hypothetical protein